jgi:hypothetical protein
MAKKNRPIRAAKGLPSRKGCLNRERKDDWIISARLFQRCSLTSSEHVGPSDIRLRLAG